MSHADTSSLLAMEQPGPLVTIIVPTYNCGHFLPQCVTSLLMQTYRKLEVIILDNCSSDGTPSIVQSYCDARVKYVRNASNIGHIRNFNTGVEMARGDYVWIVAADDWLRSADVLQLYVTALEADPKIGYAFCRATETSTMATGDACIVSWADCGECDRVWDGSVFLKRLVRSNCIVFSSVMARRECYDKVGHFQVDLLYASDWFQWCAFAMGRRVAYFAEPMVTVRVHEASLTSEINRRDVRLCIDDEIEAIVRVRRQAERSGLRLRGSCNESLAGRIAWMLELTSTVSVLGTPEYDVLLRRCSHDSSDAADLAARVCRTMGDEHYWRGDPYEAGRFYRQSFRHRPWWVKNWAKCLLVRMGEPGLLVRQAFATAARHQTEPNKYDDSLTCKNAVQGRQAREAVTGSNGRKVLRNSWKGEGVAK